MKKSLLAAMAACALLATTTHAANTPQTKMELAGKERVGKVIVIHTSDSGGMTAKSTDQFNATNFGAVTDKGHTNFKADKTSPYPVGLAEDGTPFKNPTPFGKVLVSADNAVLGKKPEVIINALASTTLNNDVAAVINPQKNGSSDTIVGTGAQFTLAAASRSPAQSRST